MKLEHNFTVEGSAADVWRVLTDLPAVAMCMPGATLDEHSADPYTGAVTVKVGAITIRFRGEAEYVQVAPEQQEIVLDCRGKDVSGGSTASAQIRMRLKEQSDSRTRVEVDTDLQLRGKVAQFGRSMLQDVSEALLQQFVERLEQQLSATPKEPTVSSSTGASHDGESASQDVEDVLDLGRSVLPAMVSHYARYAPTAIATVALVLAFVAFVRSKGGRSGAAVTPALIVVTPASSCRVRQLTFRAPDGE